MAGASSDKWVIPYHGVVDRIVPTLSLLRGGSRDNIDEYHVRVSLPRIPSLENNSPEATS